MWDQIIAFVFSVQLIALILILIGLYALLWWSIDNFKSIVQIIRSFLVPYFQPQEDVPLSEKFGSWAGRVLDHWLKNHEVRRIKKKFEKKIRTMYN